MRENTLSNGSPRGRLPSADAQAVTPQEVIALTEMDIAVAPNVRTME